ncbi:MAG: DEAD/DEAH box helicase family protein, partial [Weissella cibaria]
MINRDDSHEYEVVSKYEPTGDQPTAIDKLVTGLKNGVKEQILLGATGTGKTFTISNVIAQANKPVLVLSHNKTLAGQLYGEFKEFFPNNAVEYFVSYYDYYQPEAYVPSSDTYIEKDSSINDEIDKLRNSATASLLDRNDTIVVASVSSIFGLGSPEQYNDHVINIRVGDVIERNDLMRRLVDIQFQRNDIDFQRGRFRARGDVLEVFPASSDAKALRIEFFGDEVDRIREVDSLTGEVTADLDLATIFPATHFMTNDAIRDRALKTIQAELDAQLKVFEEEGKLLEAQRLKQRTEYDIEMIREMGFTSGIENYSRHMDGRAPGEPPFTLLDFFPDDFLIVVDESHVTMPQVRGMYKGDRARKETLIDFGFRLPSALDNRPLRLEEFEEHVNQIIYM